MTISMQGVAPIPFAIFVGEDGNFDKFFDGPVAELGDQVVLVCYHATDRERYFRLKVVKSVEGKS